MNILAKEGACTVRALLALLLLAAPLSAQEAQDTARATAELAISFEPGSIVVRGDTTFVFVSSSVDTDSLASAVDRASFALQAAILARQPEPQSVVPSWFYGGALLVSAAAVLTWAYKEESTYTISVEQNQEQTTTVPPDTVVTEVIRFPWCWPPGHCRKKPGGEDEDE
jgi:hypothetical protein